MDLLWIKMKVRPEKRKELTQTLQSIVERVRQESGCLQAGLYMKAENKDDFLMVEKWATREDSDNHVRSDIFAVLMGAGTLMQRPPRITIHTVEISTVVNSGSK